MKKQERSLLIDALLDDSISEADRLRIEAELIVDPEVRREYYQRVQLSVLLHQEASGMPSSAAPRRVQELGTSTSPLVNRWIKIVSGSLIAIAASLAAMFVIDRIGQRSNNDRSTIAKQTAVVPESRVEYTASGFAVLNGQEDAVWSGVKLREGDLLPSGELHLASGLAHLELFSGVQVVLEGESHFRIDSPMQITMMRGMARAHVPEPAQGFRIKTSSGDVVDLGTEFSVNVDQDGADVHVIDGEVELHPRRSDLLRLDAGTSRRLVGAGGVIDARPQSTGTVGPLEFQDRVREKQRERYSQWKKWQDVVQSHPQLLAHYRFQSDGLQPRRIENLATGSTSLASDGTIVAARRVVDRWNRSEGAVDFSLIGSRVRVDVPGEHRGLTLLCWVKINSLDRWYNSLFLTDGHEDREPHWQLMDDGRIFFSVKVPSEDGKATQHVVYSPSVWTPSLSGRWMMLAVTYDVDRREVTHYLNGKAVSSERIPDQSLVESIRVGQASICNWSEPMYRTDPKFVLRNLTGTMDEFAMFSTALSADEIMQWYESGNPNE
jgi:ferric-dicitrate binding protein FerR (iron transport regulator)